MKRQVWTSGLRPAWMIFLLILITPKPAQASVEEVIGRLQAYYDSLQSFSADFKQIHHSRGFNSEESGVVMMKKPGRMYWEYQQPRTKYFVADGKKAYFYVPRDRQVMISDLDLTTADTPLLFLLGKGDLGKDFRLQFDSEESPLAAGNLLVRLTPRQPHPEFSYLVLEIIPQSGRIHRLAVVEPIGSRNDYILTNFRENVRIPDARFKLDWPAGVEVIRQ